MGHILFSLLNFFIALFFTLLGILGILIPWSSAIRGELIRFILDESLAISLFGLAFLAIGLFAMINIYYNSRRNYYYIKSTDKSISVDEGLIEQSLDLYWNQLFPKAEIPCRVYIKNNRVHISVDLPPLPLQEQKPLLERIRQDVQSNLAKQLGYHDEFFLTASFPKE